MEEEVKVEEEVLVVDGIDMEQNCIHEIPLKNECEECSKEDETVLVTEEVVA